MKKKRYSRQRELILDRLTHTTEHPTAEMLYQWLKPENPSLSLGTVYRNLNLLADEGEITRMSFPVERFDAQTEPHAHMVCGSCGSVLDMELVYDPSLDEHAASASGHLIKRHELIFTGTCAKCVQKH